MQFSGHEKWNPGFKVPPTAEEIEAVRIAAGKELEAARKIEEAEKPQREREAAALERIKMRLREGAVHELPEEDGKKKEVLH